MSDLDLRSIDGVAHVETLRGAASEPHGHADLLIEVPHGADRRAHYDAMKARMQGAMPAGLHDFFYVNTDVGAWQLARATAEQLVALEPTRSVRLIRCLIPRTFIDTNRRPGVDGGDLSKGAMTPGLQPYIHHPADQQLLRELHGRYTALVSEAMEAVCGRGGLAFLPHTYGPVTMGIDRIDDDIVDKLHWAMAPERAGTWPVRPEVDLIHTTHAGESLAPPGMIADLGQRLEALGIEVANGKSYYLHAASMGFVWCDRYPGQVLTLEVRRDLLVTAYEPFAELTCDPEAVARFARPIAASLVAALPARP